MAATSLMGERSSVVVLSGSSTLVRDYGSQDGEPLVLLHSAGLDGREFEAFIRKLLQLGDYRIVTLDQRGHGQSSTHGSDVTLEGMAGDVLSLVKHIGLGQVHLLGHSVGGAIAGLVSSRAPETLRSLTIAATPDVGVPIFRERAAQARREGIATIVASTLPRWFEGSNPSASDAALGYVAASLNHMAAPDWAALWESFAGFSGFQESLVAHALCLVGELDLSTPPEIVRRVATRISAAAKLAVIPGAPHQLFLTHPGVVANVWHAWNVSRVYARTPSS